MWQSSKSSRPQRYLSARVGHRPCQFREPLHLILNRRHRFLCQSLQSVALPLNNIATVQNAVAVSTMNWGGARPAVSFTEPSTGRFSQHQGRLRHRYNTHNHPGLKPLWRHSHQLTMLHLNIIIRKLFQPRLPGNIKIMRLLLSRRHPAL